MDASTMTGVGLLVATGLAAIYPKAKTFLANRSAGTLPHDHVKALIDFFTTKKCKAGVKASVDVGKLLYEECTEHIDGEVTPVNNLP
jgi:hypothetical protein